MCIEVLDGSTPAGAWADAYGDLLTELAAGFGALDWRWHRHRWGVVFDIAFADEEAWERFRRSAGFTAITDAIPDPVNGLIISRGWGGASGSRVPRRPRPFAGAGAAEAPIPHQDPPPVQAVQVRLRELLGAGGGSRLSPAS